MKKLFAVLLLVSITVMAFAAPPKVTVIEEKGKVDSLTIEFIKDLNEARFIYTVPSGLFDKGEVIKKLNERASFFTKENGYFFYNRIADDVVRFDNVNNIATYTATLKFK